MKMIFRHITILSAAILCGCYSMEFASNKALINSAIDENAPKPMEHILVTNFGWYLFNCIPLVCGNASSQPALPWTFFSDHVNTVLLHDKMMSYAASKDADVKNLLLSRDERVFFYLPGIDIPCPIPFFISFQEVQISGVLVQRTAASDEKGKANEK